MKSGLGQCNGIISLQSCLRKESDEEIAVALSDITRFVAQSCLVLLCVGCATHDRTLIAPSLETYSDFGPVGMPAGVRIFADEEDLTGNAFAAEMRKGLAKSAGRSGLDILALSGGGQDGAYGAGVLNGWSKKGTRPEFDVVTGISTGALIAPFAFLGSDYDGVLKRFFTTTDRQRIARLRVFDALFDGGSLARSTPLENAITKELSDDVLKRIGLEHQKGRRLYVGTTNLDAERPVIWDIGRIASIGTPEANQLARRVILASASIPVVFNPIPIKVTNGEKTREELHVDGGLTQHIFAYPMSFSMHKFLKKKGLSSKKNTIWLVYNKRLEPRYQAQNTGLTHMAARTISTLLRMQAIGEGVFIISLARRDGLRVNALPVPLNFETKSKDLFDRDYMQALFARGRKDGQSGSTWYLDVQDEFSRR